ncbi:MAG TPA: NUDIX domain-containing protein [Moraxellaceae bacterium]
MKTVEKAFAYITQGSGETARLLVFRQPDFPEAGVQVPAGTIDKDETPDAAVLREAQEETGLTRLTAPHFLGQQDFDARPFGKQELHRRHFFHLRVEGVVAENWRHYESDPSDGSGVPIAFELYWLPLNAAREALVASHGELLPLLQEVL